MLGFKIHTTDDGRTPAVEYLPAGAITPKVGMALVQTGGLLAVAAGANKPAYISLTERKTACTSGELIPVVRVQPDMVLGTVASADLTDVKIGSKVTIAADGMQVTATTEGGVCEIVAMDGTAEGSEVRVRIV